MKIKILAVGQKMPGWVKAGTDDYLKRFGQDIAIQLVECPMAKRQKNGTPTQWMAQEAQAIRNQLKPQEYRIALDVRGKVLSTNQLAGRLGEFQAQGLHLALIIGGPDGLDAALLAECEERWSLSSLTLPHPLVRILLVEQLYRGCSINKGHPYHRE